MQSNKIILIISNSICIFLVVNTTHKKTCASYYCSLSSCFSEIEVLFWRNQLMF